ncbi:DUF91 domain-containing protein [Pararhodobacter marinus]|uniref:DUF91 domain-containing protein n=1 Tax=Pararhodobacter marinus TaxID=2184063 RepID=A0A2U2CES5_9RHOB|nr:endonuclease NucS domain-containing protein [Pararhodobacter marinus]PWE30360.1 DUF91 domain-containing protein [Pararhodobacter marinus]
MHLDYPDWLRDAVPTDSTFRTKLSELRRVEAAYGDLDALYDEDELAALIDTLSYSSEDARRGRPNPSRLEITGDLRNNLASYKSAVAKYQRFRQDMESEAAHATLRRMAPDASDEPGEPPGRILSMESDLQRALRDALGDLEPGLEAVDEGGEKIVPSGRIDILARDAAGGLVVIELKAVCARREVLGQIAGYMADIEAETGARPRGLIIAPDFHPATVSGARMIDGLDLKRYAIRFGFSDMRRDAAGPGDSGCATIARAPPETQEAPAVAGASGMRQAPDVALTSAAG